MVDASTRALQRLHRVRQQQARLQELEVTRLQSSIAEQRQHISVLRSQIDQSPAQSSTCWQLAGRSNWLRFTLGRIEQLRQREAELRAELTEAIERRQQSERECESLRTVLDKRAQERKQEQQRMNLLRADEATLRQRTG